MEIKNQKYCTFGKLDQKKFVRESNEIYVHKPSTFNRHLRCCIAHVTIYHPNAPAFYKTCSSSYTPTIDLQSHFEVIVVNWSLTVE